MFSSAITSTLLYFLIPVPAGISFPIMTFSLSPNKKSSLPFIAASVNTLVVSWNEAADKNESVAKEAFVIPHKDLLPVAVAPPLDSYPQIHVILQGFLEAYLNLLHLQSLLLIAFVSLLFRYAYH